MYIFEKLVSIENSVGASEFCVVITFFRWKFEIHILLCFSHHISPTSISGWLSTSVNHTKSISSNVTNFRVFNRIFFCVKALLFLFNCTNQILEHSALQGKVLCLIDISVFDSTCHIVFFVIFRLNNVLLK